MRLAEDRFYNTYPCIIITAKGQPDVASPVGLLSQALCGAAQELFYELHQELTWPVYRLFLRKLKDTLCIPVLALVDSDPYGLKILSVYMKGAYPGPSFQAVTHLPCLVMASKH